MIGLTKDIAICFGYYKPKGINGMNAPSSVVEIRPVAPIDTTEHSNTTGNNAERQSGNPKGTLLV